MAFHCTHQDIHGLPKELRYAHHHPKELIISDPSQDLRTRASIREVLNHFILVSYIEPKIIFEAEKDVNYIITMQKELNQFERNNI